MNNLSRNKPVAFVVGAAGFIGSHLVEELLAKKIQVVGVDNFSTGHRDNLTEASKDKNFELISEELPLAKNLELPRLDYAVFVITESENNFKFQQSFKSFINFCKTFNPKIILCSSIDLYDSDTDIEANLKFAENFLAKETLDNKINARIIRLSAVFGPRMHFRGSDPIIRLIKSGVTNKLNQEASPLEFTTRALYIKDAIKLLIKAIMHGSTSQKIYDGAMEHPIKVSEVKQVLIDPLWYEEKGFSPTLLPPWPTPNLNKTFKELSWKPIFNIVVALKETLAFFNSHKDKIPTEKYKEEEKKEVEEEPEKKPVKEKSEIVYTFPKINFDNLKSRFVVLTGLAIIFFALIFPLINIGFRVLRAKNHFENSINYTLKGNFDKAKIESEAGVKEVQKLSFYTESASFIKEVDQFKKPYETVSQILKIGNKVIEANYHAAGGAKSLVSGLLIISGERQGDSLKFFADSKTELDSAENALGEGLAYLNDSVFLENLPVFLKEPSQNLAKKTASYGQTISLGKALANLLPEVIPKGQKKYLIVLQDNRILRPSGGVLRAYSEVTFDDGRLVGIRTDSIENLDRQFSDRVEPPVELKTDLGESNWRLKDGSYDPDFPTSARNIVWFFNKESGDKVSGVIALDLEAASRLAKTLGLNDKLFLNIPLGREGNQLSAEVLKGLVERIFYLSKQNWVSLAKVSDESLKEKNLLVYLTNPNAFLYLSASGWAGKFPVQQGMEVGEREEFLAFSETNMSSGQDSTAIKRSVNLQTKIDLSGIVSHRLKLDFKVSEKLSGKYRSRFKVYLPANTRLIKAVWGEKIMKEIGPFSDYGRTGYSMLLELNPNEQKQLSLEYQDADPVVFKDNKLEYLFSFFKQPSQESIPFEFNLTFPPEYKQSLQPDGFKQSFSSNKIETNLPSGLGEVNVKGNLSEDLFYKIILNK